MSGSSTVVLTHEGTPCANTKGDVFPTVSAVLSNNLLEALPMETINQVLVESGVESHKSENRLFITGSWENITAAKSQLEQAAESRKPPIQPAAIVSQKAPQIVEQRAPRIIRVRVIDQRNPSYSNSGQVISPPTQLGSQLFQPQEIQTNDNTFTIMQPEVKISVADGNVYQSTEHVQNAFQNIDGVQNVYQGTENVFHNTENVQNIYNHTEHPQSVYQSTVDNVPNVYQSSMTAENEIRFVVMNMDDSECQPQEEVLIQDVETVNCTPPRTSKDVMKALLRIEQQNKASEEETQSASESVFFSPGALDDFVVHPDKGVKNKLTFKNPAQANEVCEFCGYRSSKEGVSRHKQRRHPKTIHICSICNTKFGVKYDMRRHRMNHFDGKGRLNAKGRRLYAENNTGDPDSVKLTDLEENFDPCATQEQMYDSDDALSLAETPLYAQAGQTLRYKLKYPPKDTSKSLCEFCNKEFPDRFLAVHQRVHANKPIVECPHGCGFSTPEKFRMNEHIRTKHMKLWSCHICEAKFSQKAGLEIHLEGVHGGNVKCTICNKSLSTARYLAIHMQREHEQVKRHFCPTCKKGFFDKNEMISHSMIHMSKEAHELMKEFVCSYCPKRFTRRSVLRQHESSHTGNHRFACNMCPKKFAYNSQLHKHKKSHSDERKHQCRYCDKSFKFPYKLAQHEIIHTKDTKHACQDCGKCFTSATTLKLHRCLAPGAKNIVRRRQRYAVPSVKAENAQSKSDDGSPQKLTSEDVFAERTAENTIFMCGYCREMFNSAEEINSHVLLHDSDNIQEVDLNDLGLCEIQDEKESNLETQVVLEETEECELIDGIENGLVYHQHGSDNMLVVKTEPAEDANRTQN